jgi:Flp pilus assembly protein TadG
LLNNKKQFVNIKMKNKIANVLKKIYLKKDKNQTGAAAVEFALLLPWLIAIIFGISQFGIAFNSWITLSNAAREGARLASVEGTLSEAGKAIVMAYASPGDIISVNAYYDSGTGKGKPVRVEVVGKALDLNIPFVHDWGDVSLKGTAIMRLEK